jgi:hypothetical protein
MLRIRSTIRKAANPQRILHSFALARGGTAPASLWSDPAHPFYPNPNTPFV